MDWKEGSRGRCTGNATQRSYRTISKSLSSPIVLVEKKDGTRFCVDFRLMSRSTLNKDACPIPNIEDCLDALSGSRFISILDLASGYWQVSVHKDDRPKTAFSTPRGLFLFQVMPFGLTSEPSTFERFMETALAGLCWKTCLIYLDDVILYSCSVPQMTTRL